MNVQPTRVIPHTRPLLFADDRLYCARFDRIVSTGDYGLTFRDEGRLQLDLPMRRVFAQMPFVQRVARATVYRMRVLPDGTRIFVFRGGVYTQAHGQPYATRTYVVQRGSRPVSLAVSRSGHVIFGEYWSNPERAAVNVFGSKDMGKTWSPVYTFAAGSIRHVHGATYDPWEDCFWLCAGDYGDENKLVRATTDFRDVRVVRQGGQGNRFYQILAMRDRLVTATDTPLEKNYICTIDKCSFELTNQTEIENTSFYNCQIGDRVFISTNAEPTEVNDQSASYVWMGSPEGALWKRVMIFPIDIYTRTAQRCGIPTRILQYPSVFFPEGHNPGQTLVCHCLGVAEYDDAMLCFEPCAMPA
jgi:hypothetical protein